MVQTSKRTCQAAAPKAKILVHWRRCSSLLIALALLTSLWAAQAADITDDYLRMFNVIQRADSLNASGRPAAALTKYQEAKTALQSFQIDHPNWNAKMIAFRLGYLDEKITALKKALAPAAPGATTNSTKAEPQNMAETAPASAPQVKLLEAGTEPRKVLRLHPNAGDKQTVEMTMKMAVGIQAGDSLVPTSKLPAMKTTMAATVKNVSAEGDITYEMVLSDTSVVAEEGITPEVAEAMKTSYGGLKGMKGTVVMSNRGFAKTVEMKAPAAADPLLTQGLNWVKESLSSSSAPLPEEAVGAGAKWEVRTALNSQGVTMAQTATSQLVSVDGAHLVIKSALVQQAVRQKIQNPALGGTIVELTSLKGSGTSEVTSDLAQLLPLEASVESHTEISMEMNSGAEKQAMGMKVDVNTHLNTK